MLMRFTGRTVIVTGAAAGIGRATAIGFARAGADLVLADIDEAGVAELCVQLSQESVRATPVRCNVASDADSQRLVETALTEFGRIDVLVNNAGVVAAGDILTLGADDWDRVMDINLRAVFVLTQRVARWMVGAGVAGSIVNLSSVNADLAIPGQLAYVASKGGVQQFTKAAALGLAPYGIRVNAVGPGSIATGLLRQVAEDPEARHRILSRTPLGRLGEPEEIASIVLFLASDMASYITGETIFADGGRRALNYTVPVADA